MKTWPLFFITLAIFTVALFLIRPYSLESRGMWYVDDDFDYFAHASSMVFGQYPSYKKEFFTINGGVGEPQSPIGTGILAAPFVFAFSLLDRAEGSAITETRTQDTITGSWSQFGFQASSIFYFVLACYFLFSVLSRWVAPVFASSAVILMMICQGLPLFVYRRPFFSHCSEFFLQCALMYLFLKKDRGTKVLTWAFALSGLLYLTRPNDIAFALIWPFLMMDYSKGIVPILRRSWVGVLLVTVLMLVFKAWPDTFNRMHPYSWVGDFLRTPMTWSDVFQRIVHILAGTDWGLVFTAPFLILSFFGIFFLEAPLFKRFVWLLLPMAINFYVIIAWGSQGGWYGYRYFIPSAIPVMALPLACALAWVSKRIHAWVIPLAFLAALPPFFSMVAFEACSYFNLQVLPVDFNRTDFTNPLLQVNIWAVLFHVPMIFACLVFQGLRSMFFALTGSSGPLTPVTWIRICIIFAIPWLVYLSCIFRRKIIK